MFLQLFSFLPFIFNNDSEDSESIKYSCQVWYITQGPSKPWVQMAMTWPLQPPALWAGLISGLDIALADPTCSLLSCFLSFCFQRAKPTISLLWVLQVFLPAILGLPLSCALHKLFWHLAVFPSWRVTRLVKCIYSRTLSMLHGRLSCRVSFLVTVVVFDVPSDVNRAPLFPEKMKQSISCKALWVMVESLKEINELVPPWLSSPRVPEWKVGIQDLL